MLLFSLLLLFCSALSRFHLLELVADKTSFLQASCSVFFTSRLSSGELASAFICGTSIRDPFAHQIFVQTSLIHLMVVSGSHLQMLSQLLFWITPTRWKSRPLEFTISLLLIFYALLTGFQPPVVRALISRLLLVFSRFFGWGWDSGKINLVSGLMLLALSPLWIYNFSFFLSWLACLGLMVAPWCFPAAWRPQRRWLAKASSVLQFWLSCFCVQVLMSVALSSFSLLGLLMNSLVAPLISLALFPLSLSIVFIPALHGFIDAIWAELLRFLQYFAEIAAPSTASSFPSPERWLPLWIFLAFIHGFFEFLQRTRYRGSPV